MNVPIFEPFDTDNISFFYTGKGYELVNELLRAKTQEEKEELIDFYYSEIIEEMLMSYPVIEEEEKTKEAYGSLVERLEEIADELKNLAIKSDKEVTLYRGIDGKFNPNDKGLISTSKSKQEALKHGDTLIEFKIKKGDLILDVENDTQTQGEKEVILFPNEQYSYKVIN